MSKINSIWIYLLLKRGRGETERTRQWKKTTTSRGNRNDKNYKTRKGARKKKWNRKHLMNWQKKSRREKTNKAELVKTVTGRW